MSGHKPLKYNPLEQPDTEEAPRYDFLEPPSVRTSIFTLLGRLGERYPDLTFSQLVSLVAEECGDNPTDDEFRDAVNQLLAHTPER